MTTIERHGPLAHRMPPVTQVAYLVPDLDAAVKLWAGTLGVGPFVMMPHIDYSISTYRGSPAPVDLSVALAFRGGIQIELIQEHSTGPSVFTGHAPPGGGFHHLGIVTTELAKDSDHLLKAGFEVLQRNVSTAGIETVFFGGVPGLGIVELIQRPAGSAGIGEKLRQAALAWDGKDPYLR